MKKHLFYSILSIFVLTTVVTILGITKVISIEDKYLEKLTWAFLLQLAAALISIFRKTDFFSEEEKKVYQAAQSAQAEVVFPQIIYDHPPKTEPQKITEAVELISLTSTEYFETYNKLKDRPLERDNWFKEIDNKQVEWNGIFEDINCIHKISSYQIVFRAIGSENRFFAVVPESMKDIGYSFQKGDVIIVTAIYKAGILPTSPSLDGIRLKRKQ